MLNKKVLLRPGVSDKLLAKLIKAVESRGVRRGPEFDFIRLAKRYLRQTTHSQIEFDSLIAAFEEAFPNRAAMPWEILPESGIDAEIWVDLVWFINTAEDRAKARREVIEDLQNIPLPKRPLPRRRTGIP
jgi:hypothetical protein